MYDQEVICVEESLPQAYHSALVNLKKYGQIHPCDDWNTKQKELSMTMIVENPLKEPMISKLFIGGYHELEQYVQELIDGILDFVVEIGNWEYTYHDRIVNFPLHESKCNTENISSLNQIDFVINELKRNPSSRRAVIIIRDPSVDAFNNEPACLQHIQYFIRNQKLNCKVLFRSNDACKATFMNAFALIQLQKKIADELGVPVGSYVHRANSFHCYEKDFPLLEKYTEKICDSFDDYDICYDYEDDWKELMEDERPAIKKKVDELKNR